MQIIRNDQEATFTFVPVEDGEADILRQIVASTKPEDKMEYGGRGQDGENDEFCTIFLHAGSKSEWKTTKFPEGGSETRRVHIGGVKLELRGSTEDDKRQVGRIRDTCFFGSGGLIFLGTSEVDGKLAVITTAKRCKHCNAPMIKYGRCEWKTCDACVEKCDHDWERGVVHGGSAGNIGMGEFCSKCGIGKPEPEGTRQKDQIERELEVEKETDIKVFWKDSEPFRSPRHFAEVNRLARRHHKAQSRS